MDQYEFTETLTAVWKQQEVTYILPNCKRMNEYDIFPKNRHFRIVNANISTQGQSMGLKLSEVIKQTIQNICRP